MTDQPAKKVVVRRPAAFPADPDVEHLLRLLAILPGADDVAFWNQIDAHGLLREAEMLAEDPKPSGDGYLLRKMTGYIRAALKPKPSESTFEALASYTLMFFWGDHPGLWKALDSVIPGRSFASDGGFGRRYAQELCDTALKVATRYHHGYRGTPEDLLAKWPDEYSSAARAEEGK